MIHTSSALGLISLLSVQVDRKKARFEFPFFFFVFFAAVKKIHYKILHLFKRIYATRTCDLDVHFSTSKCDFCVLLNRISKQMLPSSLSKH